MKRLTCISVAFALNLLLALPAAATVELPKNPNSSKDCAICHFRWIDTFFVEGRGTDLVPCQKEKVVASRKMCLSCHDGSVKDSRAKMVNHSGHKTGQPPPAYYKIPSIFPLDEKGNMQCATCHTAHGVPSGPDSDETIFMRTSNKDSAMCRMCHPNHNGGLPAGNHPMRVHKKAIPPTLSRAGAKMARQTDQMICETCHTAHGSPFRGFVVQNAGNAQLCLTCHADKSIFDPDGTRRPWHAIDVIPATAQIPEILFDKGAKLGDQGKLICLTCHKIHDNHAQSKHLLVIPRGEKSTFCFTCHPDKINIAKGKHNLALSRSGAKNLEGQTVAQAGVCSACHLPHKAARPLHSGDNLTSRLCLSCHAKGRIAEKVSLTGQTHPLTINPFQIKNRKSALPTVAIEPDSLKLPLFNQADVQVKSGLMTCSTCHDIHGPGQDSAEPQPSSDGKATIGHFLRKPQPELCRQCHGNKFSIRDSKHDLKQSAPQAKNLLGQTPEQSGLCASCHLVHGSRKGFLWARSIPEKSGTRPQSMCISCHNENGIASAKVHQGYSHPMDITLFDKGLSTTLPLFDHNSNLSKEGFLTCYTCHDPHRPLSLAEHDGASSADQGLPRFLRLPRAPSPLLCTNCHPAMAAVEKSEHDLTITAPDATNSAGQHPAETGPCGVCHLIHNAGSPFRLWARDLGQGPDAMTRMCNSCHTRNGPATAKIPAIASHPKSDIIGLGRNDKTKSNYFPLFSPQSRKPVPVGDIACASCHNVHQWSKAMPGKGGSGRNIEGDATNSFLRAPLNALPCKECHGPDALYRYLFFHKPSKRKTK